MTKYCINTKASEALSVGATVSLTEILRHRENRVQFQTNVLDRFPNMTLIALKPNIPGPIKNNELIACLMEIAKDLLKERLTQDEISIIYEKGIILNSGYDQYIGVETNDYEMIKKLTVKLEDEWALGRIFDYDVFSERGAISRQDLGLSERKCLRCSKPAKECGRNKTHTLDELRESIIDLITEEGSVLFK